MIKLLVFGDVLHCVLNGDHLLRIVFRDVHLIARRDNRRDGGGEKGGDGSGVWFTHLLHSFGHLTERYCQTTKPNRSSRVLNLGAVSAPHTRRQNVPSHSWLVFRMFRQRPQQVVCTCTTMRWLYLR